MWMDETTMKRQRREAHEESRKTSRRRRALTQEATDDQRQDVLYRLRAARGGGKPVPDGARTAVEAVVAGVVEQHDNEAARYRVR